MIGRQGSESITADELAGLLNTINYEITSAITAELSLFNWTVRLAVR